MDDVTPQAVLLIVTLLAMAGGGIYGCGLYNSEAYYEQIKQESAAKHEEEMAHIKANNSRIDKFLKWVVK